MRIEIKLAADVPNRYENELADIIRNIVNFVEAQFPEIRGRMNSPVVVTIRNISENETQEGELP